MLSSAWWSWAYWGCPSVKGDKTGAGCLTFCELTSGGGSGSAREGGLGKEVWPHAATLRWVTLNKASQGSIPIMYTTIIIVYLHLWWNSYFFPSCFSGQHLITALADSLFGYKTTSWYITVVQIFCNSSHKTCGFNLFFLPFFRELGRQRSTIELDTPSVKLAQLQTLEEAVNAKIRDHVSVTVQVLSLDDPAVEKVHTVSKCYS